MGVQYQKDIKYEALLIQTEANSRLRVGDKNYYVEWQIWPWNRSNNVERDSVLVEGLATAKGCLELDCEFPPAVLARLKKDGTLEAKPVWDHSLIFN